MRFTCCPNFIFLAYPWLEIHRFLNWSFCYLEQFKIDSHLTEFGQVKTDLIIYFNRIWVGLSYFNEFGQDISSWKTIQSLFVWPKTEEPNMGSDKVIFNDSISGNQELGSQLTNTLQRFNLLFLFVTLFFLFMWQNKIW